MHKECWKTGMLQEAKDGHEGQVKVTSLLHSSGIPVFPFNPGDKFYAALESLHR
jgi:hypothetical protein